MTTTIIDGVTSTTGAAGPAGAAGADGAQGAAGNMGAYTWVFLNDAGTYRYYNGQTGAEVANNASFTTLLNACITAATSGDTIFFRPGVYTQASQISTTKGLSLIGGGIDTTIFRCGAGYTASNHILIAAATVATKPLYIRGITFDGDQGTGQTSNAQGIWVEGFDVEITECKVMDPYATGIEVLTDHLATTYAIITNNVILSPGNGGAAVGPGIKFDHRAGSDQLIGNAYIAGNYIYNGGEHGIKIYGETCSRAEIIGNRIQTMNETGIWTHATGTVMGNSISGTDDCGIVISDTGIACVVNVVGNNITEAGTGFTGGIYVSDTCHYSVIANNYIATAAEHGIQNLASDYLSIVGNTVNGAGGYGVNVIAGDNSTVLGNILRSTGAAVNDGGTNTISEHNQDV